MATKTANLGLSKPTQADTFAAWLNADNANMDRLDGLPIPCASGSNSQMSYIKFADGNVLMWGTVNMGTAYIVGPTQFTSGYVSDAFTVTFPVALASTSPTISASVTTDTYSDMFVQNISVTSAAYTGRFYAQFDETKHEYSAGIASKELHLIVLGRWR